MFPFSRNSKVARPSKAIVDASPQTEQLYWHTTRASNGVVRLAQRFPNLWIGLTGAGAGLVVLGLKEFYDRKTANEEIEFRKQQLTKDPYILKGDEAHNLPWTKENLNEWLYRPVVITGRPRHSQAMLVPRKVDGYHGYDYIVPLITKENDDNSEEYGVLLNKGWIPHEFRQASNRLRIEDVRPQTFLAYVSLNSELDYKTSFFKEGNSPDAGRNKWGHVYLPDMAKATGFKNSDQMKVALLEVVDPEATKMDEKDPKTYSKNLTQYEDYPYPKSYSGALQLHKMPWASTANQKEYLTLGTLSTVFGLALKFAK